MEPRPSRFCTCSVSSCRRPSVSPSRGGRPSWSGCSSWVECSSSVSESSENTSAVSSTSSSRGRSTSSRSGSTRWIPRPPPTMDARRLRVPSPTHRSDSVSRLGHPLRPLRWHEPLVAFGSYMGIALGFFMPVLGRLGHQIITSPTDLRPWDHFQVLWNAWWIRRSLFAGVNPYFCDMLFVPYGTPLVMHFLTPVQTSAIAMLSSVLPTALSYDIVVIAGFPVAGIGAYALCRVVTRHHVASLVGGLAFMLSPFLVSKAAVGWVNMLYCGVLPLYLACLLHCTAGSPARPRLSKALLALSVLLVLFTGDVTAVFAANLTVCTFVWQSWTSRSPR